VQKTPQPASRNSQSGVGIRSPGFLLEFSDISAAEFASDNLDAKSSAGEREGSVVARRRSLGGFFGPDGVEFACRDA